MRAEIDQVSAQKTYNCLSFARRVGLVLPVLLLLFVLVGLVGELIVGPREFLDRYGLFFVLFLLLFVVYVVPASRMCRRIEVGERFVRFVQLIGSHTVAAGSILKIAPSIWRPAVLSIRHEGGTVAIPSSFDGFSEVISAIREQNPSAHVRGC